MRQANDLMTIDEQVAFAWKHRDHFDKVRIHNLENPRGPLRNAWVELADVESAKPQLNR